MNILSGSLTSSIRLALCTILIAAAAEAGAACDPTDVNGNWEIFYGPTQSITTHCQVTASKSKNLSGKCRFSVLSGGFSDWVKINKGRLKVANNCSMTGQFVIPAGTDFFLNDLQGKVTVAAARMSPDNNNFNGIFELTEPNSQTNTAQFVGVRR